MAERVFPSQVGFKRHLYSTKKETPLGRNWLESDFLQRIDSMAAKSHAKMLQSPPGRLSSDELSAWSIFVRTLFHRSPSGLQATQFHGIRIWEEIVRNIGSKYGEVKGPDDPETLEEYLQRGFDGSAYDQVLEIFPETMMSKRVGQFLNNLHRAYIETTSPAREFLISDGVPIRTNGLATDGAHYALPLSPRRLLVAAHQPETLQKIKGMPVNDLVTAINRWVVEKAETFVAASNRAQERFVRNRFGTDQIPPMSGEIPAEEKTNSLFTSPGSSPG